jgi:hydroxymethylpyrimidine pyrophosphatase-like HAD family hydrolase
MGKPFASEISALPDTIEYCDTIDVRLLENALRLSAQGIYIAIGAGGSYTAAEFSRLLIEERGSICVCHTPQSFIESDTFIGRIHILIFTASGNNADILSAYREAMLREAKSITIICASTKSKIAKLASASKITTVFAHDIPTGKDGFLATNSLIYFMSLLIKAHGLQLPTRAEIEASLDQQDYYRPQQHSSVVCIYGDWGRPAAIDLESKFSEGGLYPVLLSDLRQFGHGRHNWLDKQAASTHVVAFCTPKCKPLLDRTLRLLPPNVDVLVEETKLAGPLGALELIIKVFQLAMQAGASVGIDPGRPGIASFGHELYHLNNPILERQNRQKLQRDSAVRRKLEARRESKSQAGHIENALDSYLQSFRRKRFGALVLDFDDTLYEQNYVGLQRTEHSALRDLIPFLEQEIPIYIATGRGDSINQLLDEAIPHSLQRHLFIMYYNGGAFASAHEKPIFQECASPAFLEIESFLSKNITLHSYRDSVTIKLKEHQLTVRVTPSFDSLHIASLIADALYHSFPDKYDVIRSSHSIDIVPSGQNKAQCVQLVSEQLQNGDQVLVIGDRGGRLGNDFRLLNTAHSLSVNDVSTSLTSCWNLLPPSVFNVAGLKYYLKRAKIAKGFFTLTFKNALYE